MSDIQDYFEYIIKKHKTLTGIPLVRKYVNKIENMITFKIKTGLHIKLLILETMKLLEGTKNKITKKKNAENVSHLEITPVVIVH